MFLALAATLGVAGVVLNHSQYTFFCLLMSIILPRQSPRRRCSHIIQLSAHVGDDGIGRTCLLLARSLARSLA
jgi:hypothetical protein